MMWLITSGSGKECVRVTTPLPFETGENLSLFSKSRDPDSYVGENKIQTNKKKGNSQVDG